MDLSRTKYILPNLFTLGSVLCSTFSMHVASTADQPRELALAAWLIIIAAVCDAFDGRVARMTKTESEFGVQLDSLADAVSFGVAPAWLLFHWGLEPLGGWGVVVAFVYVACTLMRLARFNVMAAQAHSDGPSKFFTGLPSPLGAGTVVAVVLAHLSITEQMTTTATLSVVALTILLSLLMVSNVRYRTFKDVNFRGRAGVALLALLAASVATGIVFKPSIAVVSLMILYIGLGLVGGIIHASRGLLAHSRNADDDSDEELLLPKDDK